VLKSALASVTGFCTRHAWAVIVAAGVLTLASGAFAVRHFAIDTDIGKLISTDLPWRQREMEHGKVFPQQFGTIFAVVEAATPELASKASATLAEALSQHSDLFRTVDEPGANKLFRHNGLLFLPTEEVEHNTAALSRARPLVQTLATDPSLRGVVQAMLLVLTGVEMRQITLDQTAYPWTLAAAALEDLVAGRPGYFSWRELMQGKTLTPMDLRRIIKIQPILDFGALQPGQKATQAIRQITSDLQLAAKYGARVRLTGPVAIQDEEFASLKEGVVTNTIATIAVVLVLLWLALKSAKIIFALFVSIFAGLIVTAGLGFMMVPALNPISVAFAVLFVGIGVDFGIQYSVRYRTERYDNGDLAAALTDAARNVGVPLTLAAIATAAGFFSFLPTAYGGLSELGMIAGVGMLVAYVSSITLLPALLKVLNPAGEKEPLGFSVLAPIDRFTTRYRIPIIVTAAVIVLGGLPLLYFQRFDFNPMNLRNAEAEATATYLDLRRDPATGASAIDILTPSLTAAREIADRLSKIPEVSRVMTLQSFIPDDQQTKLAFIQKAAAALEPALAQAARPAPTDKDNVDALNRGADYLRQMATAQPGPGAEAANRLANALTKLAQADPALRDLLRAQPVTAENIPRNFAGDWIAPDGRANVQVYPKGDPNDNEVLRHFARAVLAVEPTATGGPISILEAGNTVVTAFIQAGAAALISITILLWITLRRIGDVLLTLIPLLFAGAATLEICALIDLPLNFANIIALPLLLAIGVAFEIYYVMAWRAGQTGLLQSSLTRAVIFSAATTGTAFGSLWLSSHPGMSSMGKLLALTLACTLVAAVLFQPLLMGHPRQRRDDP
jgi:hopanoid biosynthesis associated RND transporter like protein HpnN